MGLMPLKIQLRKNQLDLSKKSAAMAIWLGKQYLGQRDQPEENIDTEDTGTFFEAAGLDADSDD